MKPVIVLTFANDSDDYLENLVSERKDIFKALHNHHDKGFVQVEQEGNASLDEIFYYFDRFKDRIVIFHYGGHAGGTHLQLEMGPGKSQKARSDPLAQLMGLQKELRLVFLNGCATRKQVGMLLSSGVRAVIATSVPIDDTMASKFAGQFYTSLAGGYNIEEAFKMADSKVNAPEDSSREMKIYSPRDVNWQGKETPANDPLPWGLYWARDHENVLKWKLPMPRQAPGVIPGDPANASLEVNSHLIDTLSKATAPLNSKMSALIDEYQRFMDEHQTGKAKIARKKIRQEIVESLPLPLGEQLRRLFQNNTRDINRLNQLIHCFRKVVEFLCFILLSQLWDEKFVNPSLAVHEDFLNHVNRLFEPGGDDYRGFDYIKLIEVIAHVFKKNEIEYFVKEFSIIGQSLMTGSELYDALLFMEGLKTEFAQCSIMDTGEVNVSCGEAEKNLSIILEKLVFLVNYKLTTIKKIEVKKERHKDPRYSHTRVILKGRREGLKDTKWKNDSCTDDNSVILLKNREGAAEFLSLSPFVIDHNAFSDEDLSRLYFFSYQDPASGSYCYRFVEDEDSTLNTSAKEEDDEIKAEYEKLRKQFEEFKKDVLT
jgi:hypothetical protein